ncbi:MAG: metallophosphoesterase family protein [Caldilineaceae bacterium]|nr:metallophosphoesterase family protein [Caldilineaceae bacterium]MCB9137738.1 metallophosphoesterase family protein [Caldilineaceae bacterium]
MKLAVLADIHGNLPALEAVTHELERLQPDCVALNGDLINGAPFSAAVIDFVRGRDWLVVRGNHEFYYLDWGTSRAVPGCEDAERWGQLHWLVDHLPREQGDYLAGLPDERALYFPGTQPLRMTHGVPGHNRVGFYHGQSDEKVLAKVQDLPEATLVSAHTHVQIDRIVCRTDDRADALETTPHGDFFTGKAMDVRHCWHIINPGSVGLPLNGDERAQFAVLEDVPEDQVPGGWQVTHYQIPYDRRPTLAAFADSGMLAAGGVISRLFYWEVVTALPEITSFYRWAYENDYNPDDSIRNAFAAYIAATGRDEYVHGLDPLVQRGL